jgi:hypothetical protein
VTGGWEIFQNEDLQNSKLQEILLDSSNQMGGIYKTLREI